MSNKNDWYVEVCDGLKRKMPPEVIQLSKLPEWQEKHKSSANGLFSSICCYPTDDPYVGGIMSPYYADFDNEENPEKARKEVVAVVKKLKSDYDIPVDIISICFSGMKGFSLTVDQKVFNAEASADLPSIWKSISQELAAKLKLKTIDMGIYERRRLWRLPNSKHQRIQGLNASIGFFDYRFRVERFFATIIFFDNDVDFASQFGYQLCQLHDSRHK